MGSKRSAPNISKPTRMAGDSLGSTDRNREEGGRSRILIERKDRGAIKQIEDKKILQDKQGVIPRRDISKGFSSPPARGVVKQINKPRPPRENEDKRPAFVRRRENAARRSALVRRKEGSIAQRNNPKDSNFSNIMEGKREKNIARSDI